MILRLLFNSLGLLIIAELIDGIQVDSIYIAVIAAIILGVLNIFIKPILLILTLPITVITLGLFALVLNGLLFFFAASFISGFSVDNFWYALLGSLLMSLISTLGNRFVSQEKTKKRVEYREIE